MFSTTKGEGMSTTKGNGRVTVAGKTTLAMSRRAVIVAGLAGVAGACTGPRTSGSPFSAGHERPQLDVPPGATDSHIHILDTRFPATANWRGEPVNDATVAAYRKVQSRLGTQRVVVVTPSTYGTDNRATLDALGQFGAAARGVIVIDSDAPPSDLALMAASGIRGIRVNFVSPQPWGRSDVRRLNATARIAADMGWHVQIYAKADQILDMAPAIMKLPVPVVLDHLGSVEPEHGYTSDEYNAILRLLSERKIWMKLSGAYISSRSGGPLYADLSSIARSYVDIASDRLVWGSDWPHRGQAAKLPDEAALLDLLLDWAPDRSQRERILVDNPARLYGFI
ncbi:amidohydrolase family protein [Sphingobium sp. CR28]|uniref:amidohydrolase family protein n=1 Tax=Sphingobium sp. CR28 TaxID=3400272 RepID=UPI003FEE7EC3